MKINPTQFNTTQSLATSQNTESQSTNAPKMKAPQAKDAEPVSIALRDAQTELSSMPDVDMEKVMMLKSAISEGKIQVNVDELAEAMQKYYRG